MTMFTGLVSQKGQVVIPATIRKALGLEKGTKVSFEINNDEVTIKKLPTALDWSNLMKQIPIEEVEFDKNGHYDPKKSPNFHDWMVNG
ncbi:AbrB/MazE/SpoVT family DNA-binding domain-containing protein [Lactobacillus sp. ESL0791]|uniref:AbrB/MazE/SpoVT family DNA-binding domain-containing protein n=1 Tax=Lactobacillus sp. ESL0791 TaxID=2983234 RepID=UPI0023F88E04|nr:AbrB/MazE/SpoVT family DNA-binding domain-containing protein [Lactobacillus sp. ESL0791]MDF7639766.1 AbrB/MazE/SpoVT family DNA-binding domain-containing protein [Lactobacillus sp. ESL0791]